LFSGLSPGFHILSSSVELVVVFGELTSQGFFGVSSLFSNSEGFACFSKYLKYGKNVLNSHG
jgi:hypothetical protein